MGSYTKEELEKAIQHFCLSHQLFNELYESNPKNVEYKNSLAFSNEKIGNYYQQVTKQLDLSAQYYNEAIRLWTELVHDAPGFETFTNNLSRVQQALQKI